MKRKKGTTTERVGIITFSILITILVMAGLYKITSFNMLQKPTCMAGEGMTAEECEINTDETEGKTIIKTQLRTSGKEGIRLSAEATAKGKKADYCYVDKLDKNEPRSIKAPITNGEEVLVTCVFKNKLFKEDEVGEVEVTLIEEPIREGYVRKNSVKIIKNIQEGTEPPPLSNVPESEELCKDGIDNDGDGFVDTKDDSCCSDDDGDGYVINDSYCNESGSWFNGFPNGKQGGDCDDEDASINPAATETCNNKDDDCDGEIDENNVCTQTNPGFENCCPNGWRVSPCGVQGSIPSYCPNLCCSKFGLQI